MIKTRLILTLICCIYLLGCNTQTDEAAPDHNPASESTAAGTMTTSPQNPTLTTFLSIAQQTFTTLRQSGKDLHNAVSDFTASPSSDLLSAAKSALQTAHAAYMLSLVFQHIDIPNPELDLNQTLHPISVRLDQYPLIPGYLDSVPGYPMSGLMFSEQELSIEWLTQEHQFSDTAYVTLGFHALEFMLNGGLDQTLQERATDFLPIPHDSDENLPAYRRSQYIQILATQIDEDLQRLSRTWVSADSFYPRYLNNMTAEESLRFTTQTLQAEENTLLSVINLAATEKHNQDSSHLKAIDARKTQLETMQAALAQTSP